MCDESRLAGVTDNRQCRGVRLGIRKDFAYCITLSPSPYEVEHLCNILEEARTMVNSTFRQEFYAWKSSTRLRMDRERALDNTQGRW